MTTPKETLAQGHALGAQANARLNDAYNAQLAWFWQYRATGDPAAREARRNLYYAWRHHRAVYGGLMSELSILKDKLDLAETLEVDDVEMRAASVGFAMARLSDSLQELEAVLSAYGRP